ncbi:MAG: DUF3108 domain-containing protein [Thermodesulfobacteriota bacterium]|nr:DUF3108 domain-containing protein [Thermodesulfobacteriota bacterium]
MQLLKNKGQGFLVQDKKRLTIRMFLFTIITLMIISISGFTQCMEVDEKSLPFYSGEKLKFQVGWGPIPAGKAVLEILPLETVGGMKCNHFVMTARTNSFVDMFYKVRNRIDAYTDLEMTHSVLYKNRKKGKNKRDITVNFDWEKREAQYSDFGKKKKPVSVLPGTFDPLSVFYYFRLTDLEEDREIESPVTDGKKCIVGKARVIKRETIMVLGKSYDTYLVEPELSHLKGVFEKSKNARLQIWVTTDNRTPVRIKSKVLVGSFAAELIPEQ